MQIAKMARCVGKSVPPVAEEYLHDTGETHMLRVVCLQYLRYRFVGAWCSSLLLWTLGISCCLVCVSISVLRPLPSITLNSPRFVSAILSSVTVHSSSVFLHTSLIFAYFFSVFFCKFFLALPEVAASSPRRRERQSNCNLKGNCLHVPVTGKQIQSM